MHCKHNRSLTLERFTKELIDRGDLSRLDSEAVITLLAINHYFSMSEKDTDISESVETPASDLPSIFSLKEMTGLQESVLEPGLNCLYINGYLNKESFWDKGESHDVYRLREREWIYNEDGDIAGELSWDKELPSTLFGVKELKNLLISWDIGDAKIINIENLQVNVSDFSGEHNDFIDQEAINNLDKHTSAISSLQADTQLNAENDEDDDQDDQEEEDTHVASISAALEKKRHSEKSLKNLYKTYVDRLYQEFESALVSSEKLIENAISEKIEHNKREPKQPIGLGLLVNGRRWQLKLAEWQKTKNKLESNHADCLSERNRLLSALKPGVNGESPVYVQEAVSQLKQDHPALADEIDTQYSLTA